MYLEVDSYSRMNMPYWRTDTIKDVTLLKHIDLMPGIIICMVYICTGFTYFAYYARYKDLASFSYFCEGASKVWYVIAPSNSLHFGDIVAEYVYAPKFVIDFGGGARLIFAMTTTFFDPTLLIDRDVSFEIIRILQPEVHF